MIDTHSVLKMAKHVFRRAQGYQDNRLLHPERDWFIGITVFLIIMIVGGIYAISVYLNFQQVSLTPTTVTVRIPTLNNMLIQKTADQYTARAARYAALASQGTVPVSLGTSSVAVATSTATTTSVGTHTSTRHPSSTIPSSTPVVPTLQ